MFLGPSKSKKTEVLEVTTKRAVAAVEAQLGAHRAGHGGSGSSGGGAGSGAPQSYRVHGVRANGLVCVNWKPLCWIEVFHDKTFNLRWNPVVANPCGINRKAIAESLERSAPIQLGDVEWEL